MKYNKGEVLKVIENLTPSYCSIKYCQFHQVHCKKPDRVKPNCDDFPFCLSCRFSFHRCGLLHKEMNPFEPECTKGDFIRYLVEKY